MPARPLSDIMAPDWAQALAPQEAKIRAMGNFLRSEHAAGRQTLPSGPDIFRAFTYPLEEVKVLILGQDPYPTPGHPMGLSFSVQPDVRPLPRSLQNIYRELSSDLGISTPAHGDLRSWSAQGVLLLNRVLTVGAGSAGSHRNLGWEQITEAALAALVARGKPLVGILWGADARKARPLLEPYPCIESAHPSPLSASRGFFGSRPFSQANALLLEQGASPVNWQLGA
ncbi:MAG: uracil-DNA glycosylase [Rothia sp. (in: high G+C Gram-positive bacteria)]|nr:uracil-DNA glycosylase [Rothia sp. (in: high G+C Gram-positive bacteria)]